MNIDLMAVAAEFQKKLISREDKVGQGVQRISVEVAGRDEVLKRVEKHLAGELRLGLYNLLPDGTVKWAVVEFENHGPGQVDNPLKDAREYQKQLQAAGIPSYLERSKSLAEENYHLWMFFAAGIEASRVNRALKALLVKLSLNPKCEVFPKVDKPVSDPKFVGNFVWIPYFGGQEDVIGDKHGGGTLSERTIYLDEQNRPISDAMSFVDGVCLVSEEQFARLETSVLSFVPQASDKRAAAKGASKQLQRVLDNCPFIQWCQEHAENLPEPLWWPMISNLCRFEGGAELIHEISAQDKTPGRYDFKETDVKIERARTASGPITYETIVRFGWSGEVPVWPKSPAGWGVYADLDAVIEQLKGLKGHEQQNALRVLFQEDFHFLTPGTQGSWINRLATELSVPKSDLLALARSTFDLNARQNQPLTILLASLSQWNASPEERGKLIYDWFAMNGMLPYRDREHRVYWSWKEQVYEVSENQPFRTLIWNEAGITHEGTENKKIWAVLKAESDMNGKLIQSVSWLHTDFKYNRVYLNLNEETGKLLVLDSAGISTVANGSNDRRILLATPEKMMPFVYKPLSESEYTRNLKLLDDLVIQNLACPREDQLLYGCWFMTYPLIGFVKTIPSLRCEGSAGLGKTRAMELVSYFVYGENHVKKATAAANYSDGALNPLVMLDNVETKNFNGELDDFFLMAVTGIEKEKRRLGSDRGTIQEKVRCLLNSTGIENLGTTEHISRMLLIDFDRYKYKSPNWSERVTFKITEARPKLIAAHLELIRRVIAEIGNAGIERVCHHIDQTHGGHAKDRSNEFLALMTLVAEQLLPIIESSRKAYDLLNQWIEVQQSRGNSASADSNPILVFLGAVHKECDSPLGTEERNNRGIEVSWLGNALIGTAAQFHRTFAAIMKRTGLRYEYKSPLQLSKRIADSKHAFDEAGITLSKTTDSNNSAIYTFTYPTVGGANSVQTKTFSSVFARDGLFVDISDEKPDEKFDIDPSLPELI